MFTVPICDSLVARAKWSRDLMLDVEVNSTSGGWDIVVRGRDKVLHGAAPSTAKDGEDRKYHAPAYVWNGTSGISWRTDDAGKQTGAVVSAEGFTRNVIASFDDPAEHERAIQCAAELLAFYGDAADEEGNDYPYSDRLAGVGTDGREVLLSSLMPIFGASFSGAYVGSFADRSAPKPVKAPKARKVRKVQTTADMAAALLNSDAVKAQLAGKSEEVQAQILALFASLSSAK